MSVVRSRKPATISPKNKKDETSQIQISRRQRLLQHDVNISRRLAYCRHPVDLSWPLYILRCFCRLLEFSGHGVIWFVVAVFQVMTAIQREHVCFWTNMVFGLLIDLAAIVISKSIFRRSRPVYATQQNHHKISPDQFSFPSGHASRASMMAFLLFSKWLTNPWSKIFIVCWAAIVCLSRTVLGRHYASDVTAGAILGFVCGWVHVNFLWLSPEMSFWILEPVHHYLFI